MPVAGMFGSEIPAMSGFQTIRDPYSGQEVCIIPRIAPDWAILHVHEADVYGNARVFGTPFWDRIMSRAAERLIITAERIVPTEAFASQPELTMVPAFLVTAVVEAPGGAFPGACWPDYGVDEAGVWAYLEATKTPEGLAGYLEEMRGRDGGKG